jgi:hypothetical protein
MKTFGPTRVMETHFRYTESGWGPTDRAASRDFIYFDIHERKNYDADFVAAPPAVVCLAPVK